MFRDHGQDKKYYHQIVGWNARMDGFQGAILKVILETALLTDDEKVTACKLCQEAGADFVKTSTGFSTGGATAADSSETPTADSNS